MFNLSKSALIATLIAAPVTAMAQTNCPTAAALDQGGIVFTSSLSDDEVHTRLPNGTILQRIDYSGDVSQNVLAYGVHVLQLANVENGAIIADSVWMFAFDVPIAELPEPVAGGTWSSVTRQAYQGEMTTETVEHIWGTATKYAIGNCAFTAIPVTVNYESAQYDHVEEAMYFPELGTAILTAYIDDDGREDYTYTSVRAN